MNDPASQNAGTAHTHWMAHQVSRHAERSLFVLLAVIPFCALPDQSGFLGAGVCAVAAILCSVVWTVRSKSRWRNENRFIRAPWLLMALALNALGVLFFVQWLPDAMLTVIAFCLVGNLLFLEFRNRRFMAWARVRRRLRQHRRWQRRRRELQQQLSEGMRWLAALQHDIRQPLQALGLLLSSPRIQRDDRFEALVRQLQGCHQWIYELSENATEVAAIQANQPPAPFYRPVDVCAMVSSFASWAQPLANSKGLGVQVSVPAGLSVRMITTDERKLKRVLANLLHNALRYTDEGDVSLTFYEKPGLMCFEINDMAPPLPPHVLTQLETLSLPDSSRGGLRRGLGLFVVVSFCRQMGWHLDVANRLPTGKRIRLIVPTQTVSAS